MPFASRMKRRGIQILTKAMKCASIVVLGPALLGFPTANFQVLLKAVVCVTAMLVLAKAVRKSRYAWATGFGVIALLFNPVVPVALARKPFLWLDVRTAAEASCSRQRIGRREFIIERQLVSQCRCLGLKPKKRLSWLGFHKITSEVAAWILEALKRRHAGP